MKNKKTGLTKILDNLSAFFAMLIPTGILAGPAVMEISTGLTCFFWIIHCLITKFNSLNKIIKNPVIITFFLWIISICISILLNQTNNTTELTHDFAYIRFLLLACAITDISYRFPIHKYLIFGLGLSVIFGFANISSAYIFGADILGKKASYYFDTKHYQIGRMMIIAPFAAVFFWGWALFEKTSLKKILLFCIAAIAVIILIFTKGKTTIISVAAAFYFSLLYYLYKKNNKLSRFSILITIAILIFFITFFIYGYNNLNYQYGTFYHRIWIWKTSMAIWLENLWVGIGISNYETAFEAMALSGQIDPFIAPDKTAFGADIYSKATHAHNLILMLLTCGGIFSLLSFTALFITLIVNISKNTQKFKAGLISWSIAFIIIGFTGFSIYDSSYLAYFAYFIALTACNRNTNSKSYN